MNRIFYTLIFVFSLSSIYAQKPLPQKNPTGKTINSQQLQKIAPSHSTTSSKLFSNQSGIPITGNPVFSKKNTQWKVGAVGTHGLPTLIHGSDSQLAASRSKAVTAFDYLNAIKAPLQLQNPENEFAIVAETIDAEGQQHIKMQQLFQGVKVYGGEVWVHSSKEEGFNLFTGNSFPSPTLSSTQPSLNQTAAIDLALQDVANHTTVSTEENLDHPLYETPIDEGELVVFHQNDDPTKERLAWELTIHPNNVSHWKYFIDAQTGEVLHHFSTICQLDHKVGRDCEEAEHANETWKATTIHEHANNATFGGPETIQALDLNGNTQVIGTYETGGRYYMLDATKPMFDNRRSQLPDDPVGAIWTLNADGTSPASRAGFKPTHIASNSNSWQSDLGKLGVSAHSNASITYDYFLNTFNRNSFNGRGGNITSFINVPDENGRSMENAFWDGKYIYYGNGGNDFRALARSLDVAGHEIAHGVITSTANLEYFGESGAMNESFADIFSVMITRDNWEIGEDVVNPNTFTGGALRSLANPHNGGTRLGHPGWQPRHANEAYQGREDNGGVHINSGIVNYAFYLYSVDDLLGDDIERNVQRTEQIYYRALTTYLTTRSQFRDLRAAIILSARDIHGASSAEVAAANNAFNAVGITSPSLESVLNIVDTPQEAEPVEIEENLGRDFVVYTDQASSHLYIADGEGNILADPASGQAVKSKPSVTDDGRSIIYVGVDHKMYRVNIDWENNSIEEESIEETPIWRSAVISRDGKRIAAVTDETIDSDKDNIIYVFDFGREEWEQFELYNPTYTEGITTGAVEFADALEFDFSGESIMYDAFNSIQSAFGSEELNYWDIGFMKVWENDINFWEQDRANNIRKLYSGLPQDDSIGNPTFSKNSPDVIAFDYVLNFNNDDTSDDVYYLLGANILTAQLDTIFANGILNFPSYSRTDKQMIFNAQSTTDELVIAAINLRDDKISPAGNAGIFINQESGAQLGVWFSNGVRSLSTSTDELTQSVSNLQIAPNPFEQKLSIQLSLEQSQELIIEVSNLLGQVVFEQPWSVHAGENQTAIQLPAIEAGTYLLHLKSDKGIVSRKIIKF